MLWLHFVCGITIPLEKMNSKKKIEGNSLGIMILSLIMKIVIPSIGVYVYFNTKANLYHPLLFLIKAIPFS